MNQQSGTKGGQRLPVAPEMVKMTMRIDDRMNLQSMSRNNRGNFLHIATRINNNPFMALFTSYNIAINFEWSYGC
jgi:hypothetical protein